VVEFIPEIVALEPRKNEAENQAKQVLKDKLKVGIVGATGMVGQQLIRMLKDNPWFEITTLAASAASAGQSYENSVRGRWFMDFAIPANVAILTVIDADDLDKVVEDVDLVFCAVSLQKEAVLKLEDQLAQRGVFVVSCNSANRMDALIPMMIPAVNADHLKILPRQRLERGYTSGAIIVKSNCSIQSYVIALTPLKEFGLAQIFVHSEQALSGAGKTFATWPEMVENVIPYIGGEEQKSEQEPLKVWGCVGAAGIEPVAKPKIQAKCVRVAVSDGHTAYVNAQFEKTIDRQSILERWQKFNGVSGSLNQLPSAPAQQIHFQPAADRPQPKLDVMTENGMAVTTGQLTVEGHWVRFTALAHNAILGAAGGAVLAAELAVASGYVFRRVPVRAKTAV